MPASPNASDVAPLRGGHHQPERHVDVGAHVGVAPHEGTPHRHVATELRWGGLMRGKRLSGCARRVKPPATGVTS